MITQYNVGESMQCPLCHRNYSSGKFCTSCESPDGGAVRLVEGTRQVDPNDLDQYIKMLDVFLSDGFLGADEKETLRGLRQQYGISEQQHQSILKENGYKYRETIPVRMVLNGKTIQGYGAGQPCLAKVRLVNVEHMPIRKIEIRYWLNSDEVHISTIRQLMPSKVSEVDLDFFPKFAGQYSLKIEVLVDLFVGATTEYLVEPLAFQVYSPSQLQTVHIHQTADNIVGNHKIYGTDMPKAMLLGDGQWDELILSPKQGSVEWGELTSQRLFTKVRQSIQVASHKYGSTSEFQHFNKGLSLDRMDGEEFIVWEERLKGVDCGLVDVTSKINARLKREQTERETVAQQKVEAEEKRQPPFETLSFETVDVELTRLGNKKIKVIKAIRGITGLGLKDAKALVERAPAIIREAVTKEIAEEIKAQVEAVGGVVTVKTSTPFETLSFETVDVELTRLGNKKIKVIKAIRGITGLGLKDAKALVERAPAIIREAVTKEIAEEIKAQVEAVGGVVTVKTSTPFETLSFETVDVELTEPEMVLIPKGEFTMGALEDDGDAKDDEKPRHKVTLTRDFMMGKYPVTQGLWERVMGSNPSRFKGANRPVEYVSWFDVVDFCNNLSELEGLERVYDGLGDYQTGDDQNMDEDEIDALSDGITCNWSAKGYRLPTEAEWEYSARGGEYHKYSGSDNVDEVAWYNKGRNSDTVKDRQTHPVGQKNPNGFGLYDMSGNVWEWVWDWKGDYSSGGQTDPTGPDSGSDRVRRGSNWNLNARSARVSHRNGRGPTYRFSTLGFRVSRFTP